jgi:hypothetical protein
MSSDDDLVKQLTGELANFEEIAKYLIPQPGDLPRLQGIDVYGGTIPLNGIVGGDHLIYVDFKQRFDLPARIDEALAQSTYVPTGLEIRAGVLAHDVPDLWSGFRLESGVDINAELLGPGIAFLGGALRRMSQRSLDDQPALLQRAGAARDQSG